MGENIKEGKVILISGSPRFDGNTDILLKAVQEVTGGELLRIADYDIKPCSSCWYCVENRKCCIDDGMQEIYPKILDANAVIIGTPVYFNNVSSQIKAFMDRTWCVKGQLRNKVAGSVVVGRGYGLEGATTSIHSFFLKHKMIVANRGVSAVAFKKGEVGEGDIRQSKSFGYRIIELMEAFK